MLTTKELQIIELFKKNIFTSFTIREIMKNIHTNSYNWTHNAIMKLQKENILSLEKKGQSQLCTINLGEQKSIIYLSLCEELNALNKKLPHIKRILELSSPHFHTLIVTGSYANNTFTEESDMDVVVIIDKEEEKKWVLHKLQNEGELMIPPLHPYVFTREEFLEMLTNGEENYGTEIVKKHLIISGAEFYFNLLKEAIKHGFRN